MGKQNFSLRQEVVFWVIVAACTIYVISSIREILLPFILGLGIAYFLDPMADKLEKIGFSRLWATILIVAFFAIVFLLGFIVLLPLLINQLTAFAAKVPAHIQFLQDLFNKYSQEWFGDIIEQNNLGFDKALQEFGQEMTSWAASFVKSLVSRGLAFVNFLSLILITPVVAFYLLKDWDRMVQKVDDTLPREHAATVRKIASNINDVLAGFLRGQVTVLFILGAFYMIGLQLVGLNFGLLIGLVAGLISFIPFIGAVVGLILAGSVAIVQFWPDWVPIAQVVGIFFAGQIIEGNFLSPKIIGDRVRLHPVWLIFALFVSGYLMGFVGLLIAVPLAAAIGVLVRFLVEKYRESEIYSGDEEAHDTVSTPQAVPPTAAASGATASVQQPPDKPLSE